MDDKTEDISKTVDQLNELLLQGRVAYWMVRKEVLDEKSSKSIDEKIARVKNELDEWYNKVVDILTLHAPSKQQLFHFVQHRGSSHALVNVNLVLSNALVSFESYLYALEDVIIRIEDFRNLQIRREIAEKEYQTDILYKISYSDHTREIKLNHIVLARLQSDSKNVNFFEYVYAHQNQQIGVKTIEEDTAYDLANNIHDILRDLGFKGSIRKIFFPIATKTKVMFVNPISKQYAIKNDLPTIELHKITRQNEK